MKKTLFFIILAYIFLSSCEKDELSTINEQINLSTNDLMLRDNLKETALIICKMSDSNEIIQEIHQFIKKSINYGLDEELRFKEILELSSSKIIDEKLKSNSVLIDKLQGYCSTSLKSGSIANFKDFLISNNILYLHFIL